MAVQGHKRLSICYIVLGHDLLSSAGPTRNVLYLAEALSQWAEVTVAFRKVLEPIAPRGYKVVEIAPGMDHDTRSRVDDAAVRGMSLRSFMAYLRSVRQFLEAHRCDYDMVLEKSWLLSGYVTAYCRRLGLPAVVVENIVRLWNEPLQSPQDMIRYGRHQLAQMLVGHYLRHAPLIIAETAELKTALTHRWRIPARRIQVVGLGVNRQLFRPMDQAEARRELGIAPDATVLLYAGVLDPTHNLTPLLEALREVACPTLHLHIVGHGVLGNLYETQARESCSPVSFHGRVPHAAIPRYIAAADVCLAPYDPAMFPNRQVAYATLKIPEYMVSARPVISVPSGHILKLVQDGVSGFLFPNEVAYWRDFLRTCPSRAQLRHMGRAARQTVPVWSWDEVARTYFRLCQYAVMHTRQDDAGMVQHHDASLYEP